MGTYSINPLIEKIIKKMQKESGNGSFPSHEQIVLHLETNYPDAIEKYLNTHRHSLLGGAVTRALTLQRNTLRHTSLATRLADGTADSIFDVKNFWATPFFVPGGTRWKTLGELTGDDHTAIADKYEVAAVAVTARAELHRKLAIEVGDSTTEAVYDPKKLLREIDYAYDTNQQLPGGN
jgi:hypothetical protein